MVKFKCLPRMELAVATTVDTAAEDECVYTCLALSIVVAVVAIVVVYVTKSAKGDGITNETIIGITQRNNQHHHKSQIMKKVLLLNKLRLASLSYKYRVDYVS